MMRQSREAVFKPSGIYLCLTVVLLSVLTSSLKVGCTHQSPSEERAPATNRRWWSCSTAKCVRSSAASRSSWSYSCKLTPPFSRWDSKSDWMSFKFMRLQSSNVPDCFCARLLGVRSGYYSVFCGERQRAAVMRHHAGDSSKSVMACSIALAVNLA